MEVHAPIVFLPTQAVTQPAVPGANSAAAMYKNRPIIE